MMHFGNGDKAKKVIRAETITAKFKEFAFEDFRAGGCFVIAA